MQRVADVSSDKLRGGYYTPDSVVDACIARVDEVLGSTGSITVLEPSAGDGAFVRGLARSSLATRISSIVCIEKSHAEVSKCSEAIEKCSFQGLGIGASFFDWAETTSNYFDCLLGNPPFVRYQFVPPDDRHAAERLLRRQSLKLLGVSNLYIPFVLIGLEHLKPGGAFAMVLPSEILCTVSGEQVRSALLSQLEDLQVDLFPRDAFPDILQDIAVFSGRKRQGAASESSVRFVEHLGSRTDTWNHHISVCDGKWTRYLLDSRMLDAITLAYSLDAVYPMREVAKFSVSIVTGANGFFAVDQTTVDKHDLGQWARPLMARTFDSPGLVFQNTDHAASVVQGRPAWLLDFNGTSPDPRRWSGASRYLESGRAAGLPDRYKCRIRSPWYRVPHIWAGELMMSKRASLHHRVILNEASVLTTDTVYRGTMLPNFTGRERDLVAGFHNSLTLLTAELEGRTYGGGVLELVPSEIARLSVPMLPTNGHLERLDTLSRKSGGQRDTDERIVHQTNEILSDALPGFASVVDLLEAARHRLQRRRFAET